jgi:pyridoxal phosphate enzyme (YggS family)
MENNVINNYLSIQQDIEKNFQSKKNVNIISVSKTFPQEKILPLIKYGNIHFGENKVQEAQAKWKDFKREYSHIKLHMIGKLQSNKAKNAIELFDYIHSLDNQKLSDKLSEAETKLNKKRKYFIQVNLGNENQKSGINISLVDQFFTYCTKELSLSIIGLMAIPPQDDNTDKNFKELYELNKSLGLNELSMGMSSDYIKAVKHNATYLRIGSAIFGSRN